MSSSFVRLSALSGLGLVFSLAATSCAKKTQTVAPPPPAAVVVAPVARRDVPVRAEWLGTIDGFVNAQIRPQVSGYLLRQAYTEGSRVKKGDLLFEIDPRTFQATYEQVKANFDKTVTDLERAKRLAQDNVVSRQELDNATSANLVAKAALETAQLNMEFTKVTSPIDGVAGIAEAQIGNLVGPTTLLTTVSTLDPVKAYFTISEQDYLQFRREHGGDGNFEQSLQLELILTDGTVYPQQGKFFAIDRQVDVRTGSLRMAGVFPNPDLLLRPGQYARVRAVVRTAKNAIVVPQRAVMELQGAYQVYTVDEQNKAHVRPVKVGPRVGTDWVVEGLQDNDRVVVEGIQRVRDGAQVDPKPAPSPTAPVATK